MELHNIHYLDASVLVKLAVKEDGSDVVEEYMTREYTSAFKTTSLCFVEALGVLKSKYVNQHRLDCIDGETYFTGVDELMGYVRRSGPIELVDVSITDSAVFAEVKEIARLYSLDVVDAYQIVSVQRDYFSRFPEARPILITTDKGLAKAARAKGLRVWNCMKEKAP